MKARRFNELATQPNDAYPWYYQRLYNFVHAIIKHNRSGDDCHGIG